MTRRLATGLPIDAALPAIRRALASSGRLVLQAPPGAGKTTGVPLALLDEDWLAGRRLVMLEPRRLAARAAASRMAALLGEPVGKTIGYRIRLDSKVSDATRIEVVTEGILTRRLQDDPELAGVAAVIFDEFHERSLDGDLGLALCLDACAGLREDLRLVVMSATLDGGPVADLMGGAPVVTSEGRAYPVDTRFLARPEPRRLPEAVAEAVDRALAEGPGGDILVFLPGQAEIRRVEALLAGGGAEVVPLFGDLPQEAQDRALRPLADGRRKVVLATSIAETSLTIEGVRIVVDAGLMRLPRFDPGTGMTRLVTLPVSRASADQRRGRAGRLGPGLCWRLWSEAEDRALAPRTEAFGGTSWKRGDGWHEWSGRYTFIKVRGGAVFQIKHNTTYWSMQLDIQPAGDGTFNLAFQCLHDPKATQVLERDVVGKSYDVRVLDDGTRHRVYINGVLRVDGEFTDRKDDETNHFRWGFYSPKSAMDRDILILVTGVYVGKPLDPVE